MEYIKHGLNILIFSFIFIGFGQNTVEFKKLRGENVSTQSITYAVDQDSIGNIWIASEEGILKHNSKFFKIYNTYNGLPKGLGNRTTEILVDSKQNIWAGLEKGLCLYDPSLDLFALLDSSLEFNPSLIYSIDEDSDGNIWLGAYNGLWKKDEKNILHRVVSNLRISDLSTNKDDILIGAENGLYIYSTDTKALKEISLNKDTYSVTCIEQFNNHFIIGTENGTIFKLNSNFEILKKLILNEDNAKHVRDIELTPDNRVFIGTDGDGIYLLNEDLEIQNQFVHNIDQPQSLSSNGIYDLDFMNEDILWIATYGGGINYYDTNSLPFTNYQHILNEPNSLISNFTRAIAQDSEGNLWFGTKNGVSIFEPSKNTWKQIPNFKDDKTDEYDIVLALQEDGPRMWIGTYNNGLYKINTNTLQSINYNEKFENEDLLDKIYALHKDSKGNLWLGGIRKNLNVISNKDDITSYPIQTIKSVVETSSGNILAAGRNGVYEINHKNRTFKIVQALKPNNTDLAYSTVNAIAVDNSKYFLATNGAGVVVYNTATGDIRTITAKNGLPSDIAQGIIIEDHDNIWVSTTRGLVNIIMNVNDTLINVFDKRDGLATTEFNFGSYKKINDTTFAFGGIDGATIFNPNNIKGEASSPRLEFNSFKVSNETIAPGTEILPAHINVTDEILLKSNQNSFEIDFTGIEHGNSSRLKYTYKLEGFDNQWSNPRTENFATYTNINPGDYVFKVKAIDKYGNLGEERQIAIIVGAPWWATNKAIFLYGILALSLVFATIHFTSILVKKKNADEQIDFFNNITHEIKTPLTILLSSLENVSDKEAGSESKKRVKTTVSRINALFEQMLNFQKATVSQTLKDISKINLHQQINLIVNDFKPLLSDKLLELNIINNCKDQIFFYDKDVLNKIIRNLISNAIKYSNDTGTITISLNRTRINDAVIEIKDEGLGIPKDQQKFILKRYYRARNAINSQRPGTGLGLIMVKKLIENTGGSISFSSTENVGSTFTVILENLYTQYKEEPISENIPEEQLNLFEDPSIIGEFSDSKILLVEDNDELRDLLARSLANYFQVYEAINGQDGLEQAAILFPDLILTDLIMPEMDGMQMAKRIKEDINLNHIPVFMITVLQNSEQKIESAEVGISEYIEKPIDMKFLLAKIINTLKWQKQLREKYIHDTEADSAALFRNKHDQEFLQNLEKEVLNNLGNDEYTVHDLSASFGMSRTSLYMKLKNLVDLSPQDFVIHTKLKKAKNLLIRGEFSIKEVAYQSGFSNPKYFSTSFKKFYGETPSGFISNLKKES